MMVTQRVVMAAHQFVRLNPFISAITEAALPRQSASISGSPYKSLCKLLEEILQPIKDFLASKLFLHFLRSIKWI